MAVVAPEEALQVLGVERAASAIQSPERGGPQHVAAPAVAVAAAQLIRHAQRRIHHLLRLSLLRTKSGIKQGGSPSSRAQRSKMVYLALQMMSALGSTLLNSLYDLEEFAWEDEPLNSPVMHLFCTDLHLQMTARR